MNVARFVGSMAIASALASCATVESRIRRHREEFESFPPEVQRKIRAGEADLGFTRAQAEMALGRPERVYTRRTAAAEQEIWAYGAPGRTRAALGFGMATGGPVALGSAFDYGPDVEIVEWLRIVFQDGVVVAVEKSR